MNFFFLLLYRKCPMAFTPGLKLDAVVRLTMTLVHGNQCSIWPQTRTNTKISQINLHSYLPLGPLLCALHRLTLIDPRPLHDPVQTTGLIAGWPIRVSRWFTDWWAGNIAYICCCNILIGAMMGGDWEAVVVDAAGYAMFRPCKLIHIPRCKMFKKWNSY